MRKRLTYANLMASIAVFIALGGSSYAAVKISGTDVRDSSLTGRDIRNGSVAARDLSAGVLAGTQGDRGDKGAKGDTGAKGDAGARGERGEKGDTGATARWLLIDESGVIEEQSGGFTVISKPGINGQPATNPNYYIDAGTSLVGKGLGATIAIQNKIDRNGDMTPDPAFNGNVAVGRCNSASINCVPAGTNTDDTLVVRALVDNAMATSQTRRVYVQVTS